MKKFLKYLTAPLIAAIVAIGLYIYFSHNKEDDITIERGSISDIRTMAQLCAVDFYSEVPILDTINQKVIFAIQKQTGSISFDLENMPVNTEGDTIRLTLPPEIIEIHEATERDSWQVIDTKNIGFLGAIRSDRLTLSEENKVKAKAQANARRRLYEEDTVRRARSEAAEILKSLMEKIHRKPVVVSVTN